MEQQTHKVIGDGKILVDYGPVFLMIEVCSSKKDATISALAGAVKAVTVLDELSDYLDIAKMPVSLIKANPSYPEVLNNMIEAVKLLGEDDYTPMAAVAGAFSDLVKSETIKHGALSVVVNNGGDISFEIEKDCVLNIGIIRDISSGECNHVYKSSPSSKIRGIATSGFGGRSLSKGVASAVVAFSEHCAVADAAATSIANATNCNSDVVKRCMAEELDYQTDLKGHFVTLSVGILDAESKNIAVKKGLERAKVLYREGMILGSVIYVNDVVEMWPYGIVQQRV